MSSRSHQVSNIMGALSCMLGRSWNDLDLQDLSTLKNNLGAYNVNIADLIGAIDSDMHSLEYNACRILDDIESQKSEIKHLKSLIMETMAVMSEMSWALKRSCDKCQGIKHAVMRIDDLQRENYADKEEQCE